MQSTKHEPKKKAQKSVIRRPTVSKRYPAHSVPNMAPGKPIRTRVLETRPNLSSLMSKNSLSRSKKMVYALT